MQRRCSAFSLDGAKSKVVDAGNKKIEPTVLESSVHSLDLLGKEDSKLADEEDEIIKPKVPESPKLIAEINCGKRFEKSSTFINDSNEENSKVADVENEDIDLKSPESAMLDFKINSGKGLEKSSTFLDDSDKENSKVADVETEDITPTAPESAMLSTRINSKKELEKCTSFLACSKDELFKLADMENKNIETTALNCGKGFKKSLEFLDDSDSDDCSVLSETAFEAYSSVADKYLEEFRGQKYVKYVDFSDDEMAYHVYSEDFTRGRLIEHNVKGLRLDERITCDACFAKAKLIYQQEREQPAN